MVKPRLVRAARENPPRAAADRGRPLWYCLSLTTAALGHFQALVLEFIHLRLLGLFLDREGLEVTGPLTPLNLEMELLLSLKTESRGGTFTPKTQELQPQAHRSDHQHVCNNVKTFPGDESYPPAT